MMKIVSFLIALMIGIVLIPAGKVMAADEQPDTISLYEIEVFGDLVYTDDFLAVVPYFLDFTSEPENPASDTYIFRLFSADGSTEIGSNIPITTYNNGYGYGMTSFYVQEGMTANTSYIFRVSQNPAYYSSPDYWDFTINSINYSQEDDQASAVKAKILDLCDSLALEFGVTLKETTESGSTVLSVYGEMYFLATIPGLQSMAPELFSVQFENPDFSPRDWATIFADTLRQKYYGTFIWDFMTGFGGLFSIETSPAMNALSIFIFIVVMIFSIWKFKASILSAILDGYCVLLLLMLMGIFSMIWAGFMAFIAAVVGGAIIFFKRA